MFEAHPPTILLVEDDPGHARLVEKNLRRANINQAIVKASDGEQALDYLFNQDEPARLGSPTLVLLDLNLPGVDGYQVLQQIKRDPRTRSIPVIVLTTIDDAREVARCYALGCNVFITKPVDDGLFSEAIHKLGQFLAVVAIPSSY